MANRDISTVTTPHALKGGGFWATHHEGTLAPKGLVRPFKRSSVSIRVLLDSLPVQTGNPKLSKNEDRCSGLPKLPALSTRSPAVVRLEPGTEG
jgi:hypothetical protein